MGISFSRRPDIYRLLRRPLFYRLFIWMLKDIPFALPVKRLWETDSLLAFFHPRPSHPFHVILIPRAPVRSLADLAPDSPFLADLVLAARSIVAEYRLAAYRLIVNGGEYQEFPHLHFHLVSDAEAAQGVSAGVASPQLVD
jgi:histidine triad (HIT) family protein